MHRTARAYRIGGLCPLPWTPSLPFLCPRPLTNTKSTTQSKYVANLPYRTSQADRERERECVLYQALRRARTRPFIWIHCLDTHVLFDPPPPMPWPLCTTERGSGERWSALFDSSSISHGKLSPHLSISSREITSAWSQRLRNLRVEQIQTSCRIRRTLRGIPPPVFSVWIWASLCNTSLCPSIQRNTNPHLEGLL